MDACLVFYLQTLALSYYVKLSGVSVITVPNVELNKKQHNKKNKLNFLHCVAGGHGLCVLTDVSMLMCFLHVIVCDSLATALPCSGKSFRTQQSTLASSELLPDYVVFHVPKYKKQSIYQQCDRGYFVVSILSKGQSQLLKSKMLKACLKVCTDITNCRRENKNKKCPVSNEERMCVLFYLSLNIKTHFIEFGIFNFTLTDHKETRLFSINSLTFGEMGYLFSLTKLEMK